MTWLSTLIFANSNAHIVLVYALSIALGVCLGKVKIFGVSLGIAFVLFAGIACGHFGMSVDDDILNFIKEFGLTLFVFAVGLQVGPSFFSSFKKAGMRMNIAAVSVVILDIIIALLLYAVLSGKVSMPVIIGIMAGAVTNTPALGSAQEALKHLSIKEHIDLGFAVAYPMGVVASIVVFILMKKAFRVNIENEVKDIENSSGIGELPERYSVLLANPAIANKSLENVEKLIGRNFVVSRLKRGAEYSIPQASAVLLANDVLRVVSSPAEKEAVVAFIGKEVEESWETSESKLITSKIVITQDKINGKSLGSLNLHSTFGISVPRINRSGIDLLATPHLDLQIGDKVTVVGEPEAIKKVEKLLGNTLKRLNEPHIFTIFIGIAIGVLLGSIPISFPNMPMPVKLGLAGGPLITAIFIGRFGYKLKLITYTTQSANLMIKEIGICLFLASVGIAAGGRFVQTVLSSQGLLWLFCGFVITVFPLLIVGFFARKFAKFNFLTLIGVFFGCRTNPPVLYTNLGSSVDPVAVGYSTVYPLAMFLRILSAQVLVLMLCSA